MLAQSRQTRRRPRRLLRPRVGLGTESLEPRRLLVAPPINVALGLTIATGLPLPGLASGFGLASGAQSLPSSTATVAPASTSSTVPVVPSMVAAATGPATTLAPLMNDAETANATASEVARPTPGRSDRISVILPAPDLVATLHLRSPNTIPVVPGPEVEPPAAPPEATTPAPIPEQPTVPVPPAEPVPGNELEAIPRAAQARASVPPELWDELLGLVADEVAVIQGAEPAPRAGALIALGVGLAAWGGWQHGPRAEGRSRSRALAIAARVPGGPESGEDH